MMRVYVPYYYQTSEFTCGPASLVMVLKYFDPKLKVSRKLEYDVWRECNMIGIRGSDPFGLSIPLLRRGLDVKVVCERVRMFGEQHRKFLRRRFSDEEIDLALFSQVQNYRDARDLGVKILLSRPTIECIEKGLRDGELPIVLVNMNPIHGYNVPHWVVATGIDGRHVWVNDPYKPGGRRDLKISMEKFNRMVDQISSKLDSSRSLLIVSKS